MKNKIERAVDLIRREATAKTVVLSSFGKDSMVLLDIVEKMGLRFPILFFKEPFFPEKYFFSNRVILERKYIVYDYPPVKTGLVKRNGKFEVINFHQAGREDECLMLPTGVVAPKDGGPFICGLGDLLNKPTGTFKFPWDTLLIGHKSSDVDPIWDRIKLSSDVVNSGPVKLVFPIESFTDDDIWEYHKLFNVPYNALRYDSNSGFKEFEDKSYNPDYFPACMRCVDRDENKVVMCPMLKSKKDNISSEIDYLDLELPKYIHTSEE
jgi:hypothetical protein